MTEELVFRSCMLATAKFGGHASTAVLIFTTPLYFGIAHLHHAWEHYRRGGRTKQARKAALLNMRMFIAAKDSLQCSNSAIQQCSDGMQTFCFYAQVRVFMRLLTQGPSWHRLQRMSYVISWACRVCRIGHLVIKDGSPMRFTELGLWLSSVRSFHSRMSPCKIYIGNCTY